MISEEKKTKRLESISRRKKKYLFHAIKMWTKQHKNPELPVRQYSKKFPGTLFLQRKKRFFFYCSGSFRFAL